MTCQVVRAKTHECTRTDAAIRIDGTGAMLTRQSEVDQRQLSKVFVDKRRRRQRARISQAAI